MDKDEKKRLQRELRSQQRASLRDSLPMTPTDFHEMLDMVDVGLQSQNCDHTKRLTAAWLEQKGHDVPTIVQWLEEHGGYCDCEILANIGDIIEEAEKP